MQRGDRVVAIDSVEVHFWEEMKAMVTKSAGVPLRVRWERPDSLETAGTEAPENSVAKVISRRPGMTVYEGTITPQQIPLGDETYVGIGVGLADPALLAAEFGIVRRDLNLGQAIGAGFVETWGYGKLVCLSLLRVFTGRDNIRKTMGGPIEIMKQTKTAIQQGLSQFWRIVAWLSITLGIVNILPIPALDGGHLMFLAYEGITRREPSLRLRIAMQNVGMILLLAFMVFMVINDLLRL
jgi:regulator of sigma E protease